MFRREVTTAGKILRQVSHKRGRRSEESDLWSITNFRLDTSRVCDACILKQDHHCMFAGKCVAFGNQRYFVVGVFYILLGSIYSLAMHLDFTITHFMGGYRWKLIGAQLAPHLGWIFGSFDIYGCFIASLNLFEICVVMFCATLLYSQVCIYAIREYILRRLSLSIFLTVKSILFLADRVHRP